MIVVLFFVLREPDLQIVLNLDGLLFDVGLDVLARHELLPNALLVLLPLVLGTLKHLQFKVVLHLVAPRDETCLVEHLSEEQIDRLGLMLLEEGCLPLRLVDAFRCFRYQSLLSKLELSDKLADGEDFVELQVFGGHELSAHYPVQHLVEVDKAIINIDTHLKDDSIDDGIFGLIRDLHLLLHPARQFLEEGWDLLGLDLGALVSLSEYLPRAFEVFKVFLEARQGVVIFEIILGELLDDDQDEQV